MKIPAFKPTRNFCDVLRMPCLVARLKNSDLLSLATQRTAKSKQERLCKIYLRCTNVGKISPWQKAILHRLLEKGEVVEAIEAGMKEYAKRPRPKDLHTSADDLASIKRRGWSPHLAVLAVVIDDLKREAILSLGTDVDGNLAEHGIAVCLKRGRWRFNTGDYLNEYYSVVRREEDGKNRVKIESPAQSKTKVQTNPDFLFGVWEFDEKEARKAWERIWPSKSAMKRGIQSTRGYRIEVSESRLTLTTQHGLMVDCKFVGSELRGNRVIIRFQDAETKSAGSVGVMEFTQTNDLLLNYLGGLVLRKIPVTR